MSTLRNLATKYSTLDEEQIEWLELLMLDGPLLADLALGDVVLWVPAKDGNYLAVAHNRPAGSVTLFYRDVLGDYLREDWLPIVDEAMATRTAVDSRAPVWYEENAMKLTAYSVSLREEGASSSTGRNTDTGVIVTGLQSLPFAVLTVHTSVADAQGSSRIGYAYKEVAAELFLSVKTVETHVSNVLRKLQLSNRHELTAWALSRRLL